MLEGQINRVGFQRQYNTHKRHVPLLPITTHYFRSSYSLVSHSIWSMSQRSEVVKALRSFPAPQPILYSIMSVTSIGCPQGFLRGFLGFLWQLSQHHSRALRHCPHATSYSLCWDYPLGISSNDAPLLPRVSQNASSQRETLLPRIHTCRIRHTALEN